MFNWFKKIFYKPIPSTPELYPYEIRYVEDGDLTTVYYTHLDAYSKKDAEYKFWENHNGLYTDILDIEMWLILPHFETTRKNNMISEKEVKEAEFKIAKYQAIIDTYHAQQKSIRDAEQKDKEPNCDKLVENKLQ